MIRQQQYHFKNRNIKELEEVISNVVLFGKYHPLITKVNNEGDNKYKIHERPFDLVPIKIYYDVQVIKKSGSIIYLISSLPLYKPELTFRLQTASNANAILEVTLEIAGIGLGKNFLIKKMLEAQDKTWATFDHGIL